MAKKPEQKKAAEKAPPETKTVARNRKARYNYAIEDTMEAGLVLMGTEVKSLRQGRANIEDAYAGQYQGEMWLFNAFIPEYTQANRFNHTPTRPRKLLLRQKQVQKLLGLLKVKGTTLVPLSVYFKRGYAKVELAVAHGKKEYEKRDTIKERDWKRQQQRLLRT
jgi:SsrA-binding protein